jgi:hypothetical protein
LSSHLLSKNLKINVYKTIILYVDLSVCIETWSLALREDCRLRVFESGEHRRIFVPKRYEEM